MGKEDFISLLQFMFVLFISDVMTETKLTILAFLYCVELVASIIDKLHDIKFATKLYTLGCGIQKKSSWQVYLSNDS